MDLQLYAAILVGKTTALLVKFTGSGATAAPGLYALKVDKNLVKKLSKNIKGGNLLVSGTNGKTTTARLIASILSKKYKLIHNRQGSNLLRGLASTLIAKSSIWGKIEADIALWEIDEATLPQAIENTNPKIITLTNLFRDQLDRYGEVDSVRAKWQQSLKNLGKDTTLILNADDPGIAVLAKNFGGKVVYFGVDDDKLNLPEVNQVADTKYCPNCTTKLKYTAILSAHMGHFLCPNCNFKRPRAEISAANLKFNNDFSTTIDLSTTHYQLPATNYQLPGLYNVYNVLAATATAQAFGIDKKTTAQSIENFSAAFGRFQSVVIDNKSIVIFLVKNPTGANEVIRVLAAKNNLNVLAILNDKIADGRDISWIWDTNWEVLVPKIKNLTISGSRCWDLATRIKYTDYKLNKNNVYENINYSLQKSLEHLNTKDTLIILPTYTAMLEIQKNLQKQGGSSWHKD